MEPNEQDVARLKGEVSELRRRVEWLEAVVQRQMPAPPAAPVGPSVEAPPTEPRQPVTPAVPPIDPLQQAPPPLPSFASAEPAEQPSLESRIGSQVLNRIGIVAVLIGVSYFLKYAFENNWIGPAGRITIGLLAGVAVVFWSETFRRKGYKVFSYSLKAVGIGTLYLSLWGAVQVYHLIPPAVGFAAMLIVTAATAAMAVAQNAQILAAYALAGGFSTPVLVSTGENHQVFLFSYVTLLNAGILALTHLRGWRRLIPGGFLGTFILYVGWYASQYTHDQLAPTLFFATLFFATFAGSALIERERDNPSASVIGVMIALATAGLYFLALYVMLESKHYGWLAWIAVLLAAIYVVLARAMAAQPRTPSSQLLNLLHLAIAVGFLTAAVPLKLEGHWITIGWLVESAALLYVAQRANHDFLKWLGVVALAFGIVRMLVGHWDLQTTLLFNPRFGTYLVAIAVLAAIVHGLRTAATHNQRVFKASSAVAISVLALIALNFEVHDAFSASMTASVVNPVSDYSRYRELSTARDFTHSAVWMVYGAALMWIGFVRRSAFLRWQAIVLLGLTVGKVFLFDVWGLERIYRVASFTILGIILLAVSFLYQKKLIGFPGKDRAA